jgi:hypothetical protein
MNIGVGQSGSTCWFNSSINIFLTSDNGLKILWQKLQEIYPSLGPKQRAYFNSNINAPCPYKGSVKGTSSIYFWKFLNQYMCAIGGPGRLIPTSGLNAFLTKNIKWRNAAAREAKGTAGAWPASELPAILGHLGFRVGTDFRMLDFERWRYRFKKAEWTNPIMMFRSRNSLMRIPLRNLFLEKRGYSLTAAIVFVKPARESGLEPHVWACTIRNGKGYITDSNHPAEFKECSWWSVEDLKRFFQTVDPNYRTNRAILMGFEVVMYTRNEFTNKINPSCQLPSSGYRPLTDSNAEKLRQLQTWGPGAVNYIRTGVVGEARKRFAPRVLAEAIRVNSNRPLMTKEILNSIVNKARSFRNGENLARAAKDNNGRTYRINKNGPNYNNFRRKLGAKFPVQFPKTMMVNLWRNSKSNTDFANRVRNFGLKYGYTVNENKLKGIISTRAKTRAGTKRASERIYLIGNNTWYNANMNNITSKINSKNWVLNESGNNNVANAIASMMNYEETVKTYRRK